MTLFDCTEGVDQGTAVHQGTAADMPQAAAGEMLWGTLEPVCKSSPEVLESQRRSDCALAKLHDFDQVFCATGCKVAQGNLPSLH